MVLQNYNFYVDYICLRILGILIEDKTKEKN